MVWRRTDGRGDVRYARPPGRQRRQRRRRSPTGTSMSPATMPWPRDLDTVIADRRLPDSWLEVTDRTGQDVDPADGAQVPAGAGDRRRDRPRDGPHAAGIEAAFIPGAVPVLPALRRLLRAGPRQRLRQAGHAGPGGPLVGDLADLDVDRAQPARPCRELPWTGRAQAADLRRQPAGRLAAGRALQRLRRR